MTTNIALHGLSEFPDVDVDFSSPDPEAGTVDPPSTEEPVEESSTEDETETETKPSTEGAGYQATQQVMGEGKGDLRNPLNWSKYPSAVGQGLLDTATDAINWATPGSIPDIPKIPKYESTALQSWREISSLVLPFLILKGRATGAAGKIHASKVAPTAMVKLGNNPVFQRFAKVGLDMGVGGVVDSVAETNKYNDTLATSWKRGRWWGHELIPEAWTSDKLGSDGKQRANVLEGMRLGFYLDVAFGFAKLIRAGKSLDRVTTLLAESTSQKQLDELTFSADPIHKKVFSDNPVENEILKSEALHDREVKKLSEFYQGKEVNQSTVGVTDFTNELEAGILRKNGSILEAAVDQVRVAGNVDSSHGRLANVLTDAYRKFGAMDEAVANRSILKALRDDLIKGGKYSAKLPSGKSIGWKAIDQEARILGEVIADPTLPRGDLVKILDNFKALKNEVKTLDRVGYKAVAKATSKYLDLWSDINTHKAKGLLLTSEAGQISDLAEGARYMSNTDALPRAQEQILDRLELFDIESSIADFEWKAKNRTFDAFKAAAKDGDNKKLLQELEVQNRQYDEKLSDIILGAKKFRQTLSDIQEYNPEFAESLRLAYEVSDGNVQSIKGLNHMVKNQLGTYSKAIIDGDPKIPSILNRSLMSNVFNSMLSAFATPIRALTGNFGGFLSEPVSVFYGALREGDAKQLRRASHMYFGLTDTLQKGFEYSARMFKKAATSPDEITHVFRQDLALEKAQKYEFANEFAEAAARNGEYGPRAILNLNEELEWLGRNPVMRFGPNAMTGLDGFTEATQKIAQDKGMAFDILMEKFPDGNWTQKQFQEVYENLWKKGWDDQGVINQDAVDWSRREIALNLDTELVKRLNPILKRVPALRTIFWFPTTQMNVLDMFGKYAPRAGANNVSVGVNFAGDYAELWGPYGNKKVSDFGMDEIQTILAKRGQDMSGDPIAKFTHLRHKARGRVAVGNLAVMGTGLLAMQGRVRGNGHWDPTTHKQRMSKGWRPLTWKPPLSDKWVSYEWLGPLAKWVALTADGFDNFNSMSTTRHEQFSKKMGFILGAAITNDSLFGTMEPLFSMLSGNDAARNRYIGTMTNALFPLGGWRNELGKNLYGTLREVENDDIGQIMRNRNNWLDAFDKEGALPTLTDWATGKPIKKAEGNIWGRSFQNLTGMYVYDSPTPETQFLIDIEFDSDPHFSVSPGGIEYTPTQRQELRSLIGQDRGFADRLKVLKKKADNLTYKTKDGKIIKGYVNIMHYARNIGLTSEDFEDYKGIRSEIDRALRSAKSRVEKKLTDRDVIRKEEQLKYRKENKPRQGEIESILDLITETSGSN
tara:strand:- start:273 stop:4277 length:4005 start_codon:yes stop_codon:yes gene_type:complete